MTAIVLHLKATVNRTFDTRLNHEYNADEIFGAFV